MAYYRKNKRRFDPRYFMNERMEDISEYVVPGPSAKLDVEPPGTVRQRLDRAYAQEAAEDKQEEEAIAMAHLDAGYEEREEERARNKKFNAAGSKEELEEACGDVVPESFFVKSHKLGTTLTAGDPNAAADFVKHLLSLGHTEEDLEMSDEVWAVLGMSPPDAELEES